LFDLYAVLVLWHAQIHDLLLVLLCYFGKEKSIRDELTTNFSQFYLTV